MNGPNGSVMEEEGSKIDQALELQALRRVMAAYANYSGAAEDDLQRWERSFNKLSSFHKGLLPHLPKKYQEIRRCIAANSHFVNSILQAFEPPFDLSDHDGLVEMDVPYDDIRPLQVRDVRDIWGVCAQDSHQADQPDDNHILNVTREQRDSSSNGSVSQREVSNGRLAVGPFYGQKVEDPNYFDTRVQASSAPNQTQPNRSLEFAHSHWFAADLYVPENARKNDTLGDSGQFLSFGNSSVEKDKQVLSDFLSIDESKSANGVDEAASESASLPMLYGDIYVPPADVDKVRCIIRNIVRDWAEEGSAERDQCYKPILEELELQFPLRTKERSPRCLVPGAGLARLACEISRLGFESQGNEFSYYMLICSSFLLNHTQEPLEWVFYPWIHSSCNMLSDADQLRSVRFPDLHPGSAGISEGFSMCAGDFVEVYSHPSQAGAWDAVVTCFFIDTAHNIVEYLEIISRVLKPGGVWINFGPLLYHFAEAHTYSPDDEMSLEVCLEDVKGVAAQFGLRLEKECMIETTYTANSRSMMQTRYSAAFWTMIKEETRTGLDWSSVNHGIPLTSSPVSDIIAPAT